MPVTWTQHYSLVVVVQEFTASVSFRTLVCVSEHLTLRIVVPSERERQQCIPYPTRVSDKINGSKHLGGYSSTEASHGFQISRGLRCSLLAVPKLSTLMHCMAAWETLSTEDGRYSSPVWATTLAHQRCNIETTLEARKEQARGPTEAVPACTA